MTKHVFDEGHNRFEAYDKDETDAAIAAGQIEGVIDDTNISTAKTWSSSKIYTEFRQAITGTMTAGENCSIRYQHLYKRNNIVYLDFAISKATDISSRTTIANLPEGFRPTTGVSQAFVIPASTSINGMLNRLTTMLVTTGGDLLVGDSVYPTGAFKEVCGTISFIV